MITSNAGWKYHIKCDIDIKSLVGFRLYTSYTGTSTADIFLKALPGSIPYKILQNNMDMQSSFLGPSQFEQVVEGDTDSKVAYFDVELALPEETQKKVNRGILYLHSKAFCY